MRHTYAVLALVLAACGRSAQPDPCVGVAAPTLALPRTIANVGESLVPTITGDLETLTFSVTGGGTLSPTAYVARGTPGTDTLRVEDTCGGVATLDVEIRPAFAVAPDAARVRPETSMTLALRGLVGDPVVELVSSGSGATLEGLEYTAGTSEGVDTIRVSDDVTLAEATVEVTVDTDAALTIAPARVAMPAGSSIPLTLTHGSGHVTFEVVTDSLGVGSVSDGRFGLPQNATGEQTIVARDVFTHEEVEAHVEVLVEPPLPAEVGARTGTALALARRGVDHVTIASGTPDYTGGGADGRAHTQDLADFTIASALVGGASPLVLGREVGAGVAFTDFDGDGRLDLVAGAPGLVVPASSDATELASYAMVRASCLAPEAQAVGGVLVARGNSDGTFTDAYRLFTRPVIAGCVPDTDPACLRTRGGAHVAGGFDANGDGREDVAMTFGHGVDVVLGVPPDAGAPGQRTMLCDTHASLALPGDARSVEALGDLNGDACDELAVTYDDGAHAGVVVLFGFDAGGSRCGGRTTSSFVRIAEDAEVDAAYAGLGTSVARAGRLFGPADVSALAIGARSLTVDGVAGPAVVFVDIAAIVAARPMSGEALRGLTRDALRMHAITLPGSAAFGATLRAGADLDGDAVPDLVVGAPDDAFVGPGAGAVYVFAGGTALRDHARAVPALVIAGDEGELGFGRTLASLFDAGGRLLAIGAPASERVGPGSGAVFTLAF